MGGQHHPRRLSPCLFFESSEANAKNLKASAAAEKQRKGPPKAQTTFQGETCQFASSIKANLALHIKDVHGTNISTKEHVNAVHLKVKDVECDGCDFATAHRSSMSGHKKKAVHVSVSSASM